MKTVFISSTSRDLAEYRQAAEEVCKRLELFPIAMEYFEAMPVGATEGSKRQLDKADIYVGIFAHRYGYIENGVGVTEAEFDHAGTKNIPRLCFLVDPSYPWPPEAKDDANLERLQAFKKKIDESLIRVQFTDVNDFAAKLTQALVKHTMIQNPDPQPNPVGIAPPRPNLIIGRDDDIKNLKYRIFGKSKLTVIRGWPGVGKTTTVTYLAYDDDVIKMFPDGILWAHVDEYSSPLNQLSAWGRSMGVPNIGKTLEEAGGRMRAILRDKRALLIVDDVWNANDWSPFNIAGPNCSTLITTRVSEVARQIAVPEDVYVLSVLSNDLALQLLQRLAPSVTKEYPQKSEQLVVDLEGLPLAIRVAGRLLDAEASLGIGTVTQLMDDIREKGKLLEHIAPEDRFDPRTGTTPTISYLLQRSTDRLDQKTRDCFAFLGPFAPKPATFDLEAMKSVWQLDDPLPIVRKLVDFGLLETIPAQGRFWMHRLLVMHAQALLE